MNVRSVSGIDGLVEGELQVEWVHQFPMYRVDFWGNPDGEGYAWTKYTFEIDDAHNVQQVLAWADASARGRLVCVYAIAPYPGGGDSKEVELLQLSGTDPTRVDDPRSTPPADLAADAELQDADDLERRRERARRRVFPDE
jgi:hypothetical protein